MAGAAHQRRAGRRERRKVVMAPKAPSFECPPGTRIVPVRDLYPMKPPDSQPASVAVALARMANAAAGRISRRAPLRVRLRSDGCFDVVDGNATYAAARELGWPELPVLVEPASE